MAEPVGDTLALAELDADWEGPAEADEDWVAAGSLVGAEDAELLTDGEDVAVSVWAGVALGRAEPDGELVPVGEALGAAEGVRERVPVAVPEGVRVLVGGGVFEAVALADAVTE